MKAKKIKIKFLTIHRPDRSPSQRFRFEQYIDFLTQNGYDCKMSYLLNEKDDKIFYQKGKVFYKAFIIFKGLIKRLVELYFDEKYDIIFVQRESIMLGTSFIERKYAKRGVKLVFDFDDSIWIQNVSDANKMFRWLKNPSKTSKIISYASLVFAGNEYLKNYALKYNENVIIVPTTIDTNEYTRVKQKNKDEIVIGWSGSITTIQHFEYALPFLREIKNKYQNKVKFRVIGDANYINRELNIKGKEWNKTSEIEDLSEFDIGIMPLPDDEWANGRCGLKGLQYMALKIPTIMSPIGVNSQIISDGVNGMLASNVDEWVNKISQLIESSDLRNSIGEKARITVEEKYSVVSNRQIYLKSFKDLV